MMRSNNLFETLQDQLDMVCNNYKNDYVIFQNTYTSLANEIQEWNKLIRVNAADNKNKDFALLLILVYGLISHLGQNSKRFKNALETMLNQTSFYTGLNSQIVQSYERDNLSIPSIHLTTRMYFTFSSYGNDNVILR